MRHYQSKHPLHTLCFNDGPVTYFSIITTLRIAFFLRKFQEFFHQYMVILKTYHK